VVDLPDVDLESVQQSDSLYSALKEQGLDWIQQLSGDIWTDYNEHDPGVTTLEQYCYALTELIYRSEFPVPDLLLNETSGQIDLRRHALYVAKEIFPCNPVTENDYRKLFVDQVVEVGNAWLQPHCHLNPSKQVEGLYDIWVYVPQDLVATKKRVGCEPETVLDQVREVYSAHRGLCEDVRQLKVLSPLLFEYEARISIADVSPDQVMAQIIFELGQFLAPELKREPLSALISRDESVSEIFNGPLLRHGFISDEQMQIKADCLAVLDMLNTIMAISGVLSVQNLRVKVPEYGETYQVGQSVAVATDRIGYLDADCLLSASGNTIRLFQNGQSCRINPARVRRKLDRLLAKQRQTFLLAEDYQRFFPVPEGKRRDLRAYESIQNQYPDVYGINQVGLPDGVSDSRKAQAKQFKGYLLIYDQLMADFFAQLSKTKDLYSLDRNLKRSYFFQYLNHIVPDVDPLLKSVSQCAGQDSTECEPYRVGLPRLIEQQDDFIQRRNRFLDQMLALYSESATTQLATLTSCQTMQFDGIEMKLRLLKHMLKITAARGTGFDYQELGLRNNLAGMVIKCRILLGMRASVTSSLIDSLEQQGVSLVEQNGNPSIGQSMGRYADQLEESFTGLEQYSTAQDVPEISGFRAQSLSDEFLTAASNQENFRVGRLEGETRVTLSCYSEESRDWFFVGKFDDEAHAVACAQGLFEQARKLRRHSEQLYIVEHNLLRFGRSYHHQAADEQDDSPLAEHNRHEFNYSLSFSAVIGAPWELVHDRNYRNHAKQVIRENSPCHLAVDYVFLAPFHLARFEYLYWHWRRALRQGNRRQIVYTSARLRRFLQRH